MEYSLASYLIPLLESMPDRYEITMKMGTTVLASIREFYGSGSMVRIFNAAGRELYAGTHRTSSGYVRTGDPFFGNLRSFFRDHLSMDPAHLDPATLTFHLNTGEKLPIQLAGEAKTQPWQVEGNDAENLRLATGDDKSLFLDLSKELVKRSLSQKFMMFLPLYRRKVSFRLYDGEKVSSSFVLMTNGAVFEYGKQKILATSLDAYMRMFLELPEDIEITWQQYVDHILLANISLRIYLKALPTVVLDVELIKAKNKLQTLLRSNLRQFKMNNLRYGLELLSVRKETVEIELYKLNSHWLRKASQTYGEAVSYTEFCGQAQDPSLCWYGRLTTQTGRVMGSHYKAINLVLE